MQPMRHLLTYSLTHLLTATMLTDWREICNREAAHVETPTEKQAKPAKPLRLPTRRRADAAVSAARSETLSPRHRPRRLRRNHEVASHAPTRTPATTSSRCATWCCARAEERRDEFYPDALATDSVRGSALARRCRSRRHHDASARAAAAHRSGAARRQARAQPEAVRASTSTSASAWPIWPMRWA